jgi:hypothetical protein
MPPIGFPGYEADFQGSQRNVVYNSRICFHTDIERD